MATIRHLDLPMPDGTCDAVRALPDAPAAPAALPTVLFLMDAVGLRPRLFDMIRTVADMGYAVLAPNVYYREGRQPLIDPAVLTPERDDERVARMMTLIRGYDHALWSVDGPAYVQHLADWAAQDERVAPGPARVVGYCMGGRLGILLAAQQPEAVACVAGFHTAGLVTDADDSAHRQLGTVGCPVYLGYADQDGGATPQQQETFREAARAAGVELTDETYAGARHGYTMADLPAYDEAATARHWTTLRDFFARA